ncbi:hypothetical protein PENTCL1PPCAC_14603, partial [Pristionchus entomophagus]
MLALAISDIGGLSCLGSGFGYAMVRGMVFCPNPSLAWAVGCGELFFWVTSSSYCMLLVVNKICEIAEGGWIFQGRTGSLCIGIIVIYGTLEMLFTAGTPCPLAHMVASFDPFIPGHSSEE